MSYFNHFLSTKVEKYVAYRSDF